MADEKDETNYGLLWILLGVALVLYTLYWIGVTLFVDAGDRGVFGDMFGGVNALFTAAAFAGLIFTAILQKKELGYQREELEATRKELAGQRVEFETQNALARQQSFESTFFELLRLHHTIVDALFLEPIPGGHVYRGREAFEEFHRELKYVYETTAVAVPRTPEGLSEVDSIYTDVYTTHQAKFGHYFRNFYHILKFVERARVDDKARYAAFARAQLSSYELICMFYNGLSQHGYEKFKPLAETFTLFKNMPWELLLSEEHLAHYESKALFRIS